MEEETGERKLVAPQLFPLVVLTQYPSLKLTLMSPMEEREIKIPPKLRRKEISSCSHGWIIFSRGRHRYSLWNPFTNERIHLPAIHLKHKHGRCGCQFVLSLPPANRDSMVILIDTETPSLNFCRIADKQWTKQPIQDDCVKIPCSDRESRKRIVLVESFGELFGIVLGYIGRTDTRWKRVTAVEVYKLDFLQKEWNKVESFKDRAFFVSWCIGIGFSYPKAGLEADRVHYDSAYLFNMEEKTISISLPYSYLQRINEGHLSFYIMQGADSRLSNYVERQINDHLAANSSEILRDTTSDHDQQKVVEAEFVYFGKLPLDVQSVIARCLGLHDYLRFRATNRMCRLAAPPIQSLEGIEGYNSLPPWLTFWEKGESVCNFIDPTRCQKYIMTIPNNESKDVTMCYSREGWCLMLQGERSIFLWNPLAKKIIPLPNLPHKCRTVFGCGFSTSPDSSDCVIVMLCHGGIHRRYYIDFISLKDLDKEWDIKYVFDYESFFYIYEQRMAISHDNNLAFYEGNFYVLDVTARLGVFKITEDGVKFEVLNKPESPCDCFFDRSFLLECDGKLLSVIVDRLGKWLRIFRLDDSEMVWVEVENLGNYTLYVSRLSCFSVAATPRIKKRVYLPRYYGKSVVYYSLDSRKFHSHGAEDVLDDLDNTKEQLFCGWVEARF